MHCPPNFLLSGPIQLLTKQHCTLHRRNRSARNRFQMPHRNLAILNNPNDRLVTFHSLLYTHNSPKNPKIHLQRTQKPQNSKGYYTITLAMIAVLSCNLVLLKLTLLQSWCYTGSLMLLLWNHLLRDLWRAWFIGHPLWISSALTLGIQRGQLCDDGGPKCHRNVHKGGRQSPMSEIKVLECTSQWTQYRITRHLHGDSSKCRLRSSHHTSHINSDIMWNVQQHSHSRLPRSRWPSLGLVLPKYCKSPMHIIGSNLARSRLN